jgi:hypothetical protein
MQFKCLLCRRILTHCLDSARSSRHSKSSKCGLAGRMPICSAQDLHVRTQRHCSHDYQSRRWNSNPSSFFSQTPTLNARPVKRAIKQACRRGVEVVLYLDLGETVWKMWRQAAGIDEIDPSIGFNDKGESIPFQGGTNEQVVEGLYTILRKEKKEQHLKVYWCVWAARLAWLKLMKMYLIGIRGKTKSVP